MLELINIKKNYQSGDVIVPAIKDISFRVEQGYFLSLVGPSGCGKTTLLNILGAIDKADEGSTLFEGKDLKTFSEKEMTEYRKNNIGFIFQAYNLIPVLTAYENIEFVLSLENIPKNERKEIIQEVLEFVDMNDKGHKLPSQLSGGEQQRISIARALVKKSKIVLADEPTANLDSKRAEEILEVMMKLNEQKNITFIFSTHDPLVMQYAKQIITLKDGYIEKQNIKK